MIKEQLDDLERKLEEKITKLNENPNDTDSTETVSYTHLDVYKRQH